MIVRIDARDILHEPPKLLIQSRLDAGFFVGTWDNFETHVVLYDPKEQRVISWRYLYSKYAYNSQIAAAQHRRVVRKFSKQWRGLWFKRLPYTTEIVGNV